MNIAVAVACTNASGEPDFYLTSVEVSDDEYQAGAHYVIAESEAVDHESEGPYVSFDERDAPWLIAAVRQYLAEGETTA